MPIEDSMREYYARRAGEYERIYAIPARQGDIAALTKVLQDLLSGHDILEVACGTGYWTEPLSHVARSILATDVNSEVIELAMNKPYPAGNVRFQLADAYTLDGVQGEFSAGFAGFWWSHIPKSRLRPFLQTFHSKLGPGRLVVLADNNYVEGEMHPITRRDAEGNTYQMRKLESGAEFEVLKNIPDEAELRRLITGIADEVKYISLKYYWCLSYRTTGES
jgi:demethylmenaquinone methyltransferase/2-methoxy-6-polyprenyl-1,4-benzoquinol methylase